MAKDVVKLLTWLWKLALQTQANIMDTEQQDKQTVCSAQIRLMERLTERCKQLHDFPPSTWKMLLSDVMVVFSISRVARLAWLPLPELENLAHTQPSLQGGVAAWGLLAAFLSVVSSNPCSKTEEMHPALLRALQVPSVASIDAVGLLYQIAKQLYHSGLMKHYMAVMHAVAQELTEQTLAAPVELMYQPNGSPPEHSSSGHQPGMSAACSGSPMTTRQVAESSSSAADGRPARGSNTSSTSSSSSSNSTVMGEGERMPLDLLYTLAQHLLQSSSQMVEMTRMAAGVVSDSLQGQGSNGDLANDMIDACAHVALAVLQHLGSVCTACEDGDVTSNHHGSLQLASCAIRALHAVCSGAVMLTSRSNPHSGAATVFNSPWVDAAIRAMTVLTCHCSMSRQQTSMQLNSEYDYPRSRSGSSRPLEGGTKHSDSGSPLVSNSCSSSTASGVPHYGLSGQQPVGRSQLHDDRSLPGFSDGAPSIFDNKAFMSLLVTAAVGPADTLYGRTLGITMIAVEKLLKHEACSPQHSQLCAQTIVNTGTRGALQQNHPVPQASADIQPTIEKQLGEQRLACAVMLLTAASQQNCDTSADLYASNCCSAAELAQPALVEYSGLTSCGSVGGVAANIRTKAKQQHALRQLYGVQTQQQPLLSQDQGQLLHVFEAAASWHKRQELLRERDLLKQQHDLLKQRQEQLQQMRLSRLLLENQQSASAREMRQQLLQQLDQQLQLDEQRLVQKQLQAAEQNVTEVGHMPQSASSTVQAACVSHQAPLQLPQWLEHVLPPVLQMVGHLTAMMQEEAPVRCDKQQPLDCKREGSTKTAAASRAEHLSVLEADTTTPCGATAAGYQLQGCEALLTLTRLLLSMGCISEQRLSTMRQRAQHQPPRTCHMFPLTVMSLYSRRSNSVVSVNGDKPRMSPLPTTSRDAWQAAYSQHITVVEAAVRLLTVMTAAGAVGVEGLGCTQPLPAVLDVMRVPKAAIAQLISSSLVTQAKLTQPRSHQQLQLYGLMCSVLKLSGTNCLPQGVTAALAASVAAAKGAVPQDSPTPYSCFSTQVAAAAAVMLHSLQEREGRRSKSRRSIAALQHSTVVDGLPWLTLLGRCCLQWSAQLRNWQQDSSRGSILRQEVMVLLRCPHAELAHHTYGLYVSKHQQAAGRRHRPRQQFKDNLADTVVQWLQQPLLTHNEGPEAASDVQLPGAAANAGLNLYRACLAGLSAQLDACCAALRFLEKPDRFGQPAALEWLIDQLQVVGVGLTALPVPQTCNNPHCSNVQGLCETQLVSTGSCVCGGCCVACYCGPACLKQHWQQHKPVCKMLAARRRCVGGPSVTAA